MNTEQIRSHIRKALPCMAPGILRFIYTLVQQSNVHWAPNYRKTRLDWGIREATACGVKDWYEITSVKKNVTCRTCIRAMKKF